MQVGISQPQAVPTAMYLFDSPTTATVTNNLYNSGNPAFYLDQNGEDLGTAPPRYVGNGLYYEGENKGCTHAPGGIAIDNNGDFTVDMWVYVNMNNIDSCIVGKYYHQGTGISPNERFCIGHDNSGGLWLRINGVGYNSINSRTIFSVPGCQYDYGWNHVTVSFTQTGSTAILCWIQTDSGKVTSSSYNWYTTINDDPSHNSFLCCGGSFLPTTGGALYEFTGIVNRISFYSTVALQASDIGALYSTNCNGYCNICQISGTAPYSCLQEEAQSFYLENYDFTQPTYPTTQIQPDQSNYGFDLSVNQNFAFTPAYVDSQGLWFDMTYASQNQYLKSVATTYFGFNVSSFTIESWIRPTATPTSSTNIYEKLTATSFQYYRFGFSGSTTLIASIFGQSATQGTGTVSFIWHFVATTIVKYAGGQSKMCVRIDSSTASCSNIGKVFNETALITGTYYTQIGNGFQGYIRQLKVYDYAKENLDLTTMNQNSGCTKNTNGNTCTQCPFEYGQCIPDCNYGQYVNSTTTGCTACYYSCRTCFDAYGDTCFSCLKTPSTWSFDYVNTCQTACGDSIRDDYEQCDDGNTANGDGCSSTCSVETGFACMGGSFGNADTCYHLCGYGVPVAGHCDDGNTNDGDGCDSQCNIETGYSCSGAPSTCKPVCGDSKRVGTEGCDDGNTASGDGCSSSCAVETGFNCTGGSVISKDYCQEICGDGKDFGKYGCEDGNLINFDGCDQNCRVEVGFTCSGGTTTTKDTCTEICGDGRDMHTYVNECDDGNTKSGDGCSSACKTETGFKCQSGSSYTKDTCYEICGDGINMGQKQCDDGNVVNGDGCHSDCTIEIGWLCSGGNSTMKDTCTEICGDGRNFGSYACDDGNLASGDGCSSTCTVEKNWICTTGDPYTASVCTKTCDGIRDFTDMCDDGNIINGDGCDYCCHREVGYSCTGGSLSSADTCTEACGDGRKMNLLQCDDGNIVSGDGCSSTCSIETGFQCAGGTIFTPDVCKEICGDGKNMGMYQCDDGNVASDDGCSSVCFIENGFTCTTGNATKASVCKETCGDGKNMKSYLNDCDDGNTQSGDGCSSTCIVETGYKCAQGSYYDPDICVEICGDGLNYGMYQCDDGNTQDGDGCSSYCSIEKGYKCSGGSHTSPDVCYGTSDPVIISASFTQNNQMIILIFNETMIMNSAWSNNSGAWIINFYGPLGTDNYQFYWDVNNQLSYKNPMGKGSNTIEINIKILSQLFGDQVERVVISFNDRTSLSSLANHVLMYNTSTTIYPYGQDDQTASGSTHGLGSTIDKLTTSLILVSIGVGFLGSFQGLSMMDVWIMMQGLQQVYLIPVNNLEVPTALTNYFILLDWAMPQSQTISQLCFGGSVNITQINSVNPSFSQTYSKMGYTSNAILQTGSDALSLLVYCFVFCSSLQIFRLTFQHKKNVNKVLYTMISSIFLGYITFCFQKLAFVSHLNIKNFNIQDSQNSLSSLLSLAIAISLWSFMIYTGYQAYQFYQEIKHQREQNLAISDEEVRDLNFFHGNIQFQDYQIRSYAYPLTIFYPAFLQLKQLLSICLIISDNTVTQLQGLMILNVLSLTTGLLLNPYTSYLMNIIMLISEVQVLILHMQAHYFIPKTVINQSDQLKMTKLIVVFTFLALSAQSLIIIFSKMTKIIKCKSYARDVPADKSSNISKNKVYDQVKKSTNKGKNSKIKQNETQKTQGTQNIKDQVKNKDTQKPEVEQPQNGTNSKPQLNVVQNSTQQNSKQKLQNISEKSDSRESYDSQSSSIASRSDDVSYDSEGIYDEESDQDQKLSKRNYQQNSRKDKGRRNNDISEDSYE